MWNHTLINGCCPSCSVSWTVLYSEGHRCFGAVVIPECLGDNDPTCPWDGKLLESFPPIRISGDPTLVVVWYWEVGPLGLEVDWYTTTGEVSIYAEYGEPPHWTGNGVKEYPLGFSGRESLSDSWNYSPEKFSVTPLEETCLLITKEWLFSRWSWTII